MTINVRFRCKNRPAVTQKFGGLLQKRCACISKRAMARAGASLDAVGEPSGESFRPTSTRTLPKNPSQLPLIASFPLCRLLVTLYTYSCIRRLQQLRVTR